MLLLQKWQGALPGGARHLRLPFRVGKDFERSRRHGLNVARLDQKALHAIADNFRHAAHAGANRRERRTPFLPAPPSRTIRCRWAAAARRRNSEQVLHLILLAEEDHIGS